ncbi:MAG TPA: carboxypeptidase M32 [Xanthobacteraceae bacterium]
MQKVRSSSGPKPARAARPRAGKVRRSDDALLAELKACLHEIGDLEGAAAILSWDQSTYMPSGGAPSRGRQSALLSRLLHERKTDPRLGQLIDALAPYAESLPPDSDDAALIAVTGRDFAKAVRVPARFVEQFSQHSSASYDAWTRARQNNDFATMRPLMERTLDLSCEYAEFFAPYRHVIDPLIDDMDEGMTCAAVRALFTELRGGLLPLVRAICDRPAADESCLHGGFAEAPQLDFGLAVAKAYGYDLDRGRLDRTFHPFCTRLSAGDVRITTRVDSDDLTEALFSTLHEAGHGLYEQGVAAALDGTPLGSGTSAGVHESQSRLWENVVGRSRGFWQHYYPVLRATFPGRFGDVQLETFYRAINKVERSLIRTDADEVTYNLHIILRFELELDLLERRLAVEDLPQAWRARYQSDLGVSPADDRDGCLQDVHWFAGRIGGAFQSYTIGNILSAQFYAAALRARPEIPAEIGAGRFATLHGWLEENLYRHGRKFEADAVVQRATGEPMTIGPYMAYLTRKYGELYDLPPTPSRRPDTDIIRA